MEIRFFLGVFLFLLYKKCTKNLCSFCLEKIFENEDTNGPVIYLYYVVLFNRRDYAF